MTRRVVIVFVLASAAIPGAAMGCTCARSLPPCQAFWTSDAVFDGTVIDIERVPRRLAFDDGTVFMSAERVVTFRVLTAWRGVSRGVVSIATGPEGGDCWLDFAIDGRYVVYAAKSSQDGRLEANFCGRTAAYAGAGEDVAFFESLSRPATGGRVFGKIKRSGGPPDSAAPPRAGRPIETPVHLTGPGFARTVPSTNGKFEFTGLAPGTYSLRIDAPPEFIVYAGERSVDLPNPRACVAEEFQLSGQLRR